MGGRGQKRVRMRRTVSPEPYRTSGLHASAGYCNPRGRNESEARHVVFSGTRPMPLCEDHFRRNFLYQKA